MEYANNNSDEREASNEEVYFSATEEELPSRPWTEDDETSLAARPPSSSSGGGGVGRRASSASLLSTTSSPTAEERHGWRQRRRLRFALLFALLAWFSSLAALCVDTLFFTFFERHLIIDIILLSLSAARSFGSITLTAVFVHGRHSERKYIFTLILSALLLAVSVFISAQTVAALVRMPVNSWLLSIGTRLQLSSCVLDALATLLYFLTTAITIALLHESENDSISSEAIGRKRGRSFSSEASSHYLEL